MYQLVISREMLFQRGEWRNLPWYMRVQAAIPQLPKGDFSRKDYMEVFKGMKTATGSTDLRNATQSGMLRKIGDKRVTRYQKA